ncbi:MAG: hypothetical protein ACLPZM_05945 [Thermoplasmata archaeon]
MTGTGSSHGVPTIEVALAGVAYPVAPAPVPRVRMRASVLVGLVLFFVGTVGAAAVSFTGDLGDTIILAILAVVGIALVTRGGRPIQTGPALAAPPSLVLPAPIQMPSQGGSSLYPAGVAYSPPPTLGTLAAPAPSPPAPAGWAVAPMAPFCTGCGKPTIYFAQYGRYYCYPCARYA